MTNLIIAALFRGSTPLPFAQTHSEQPCVDDILSAAFNKKPNTPAASAFF